VGKLAGLALGVALLNLPVPLCAEPSLELAGYAQLVTWVANLQALAVASGWGKLAGLALGVAGTSKPASSALRFALARTSRLARLKVSSQQVLKVMPSAVGVQTCKL
jgi:hypothetical protein